MNDQKTAVVRVLKALSRHAEVIAEAYVSAGNEILDETGNGKAIQLLMKERLAWRPDAEDNIRLRRQLIDLLDFSMMNVHRLRADTDIGGRMADIESLVVNYKEAQRSRMHRDREQLLGRIEDQVGELNELLTNASRNLWVQIDNGFGWIPSLEGRAKESERVLGQTQRLARAIRTSLRREDLSELAGSDRHLRRMLVGRLPDAAANCRAELNDAVSNLKTMLFEFRRQHARGRIINFFRSRYQERPDWQPGQDIELIDIPDIINQVAPMKLVGSPDLLSDQQTEVVTRLLAGIRKERLAEMPVEVTPAVEVDDEPVEVMAFKLSPLRQAVHDFLVGVLDTGQGKASIAYQEALDADWSPEVWVFAIQAHLDSLVEEDRAVFRVNHIDTPDPLFTGLWHIQDLEVSCAN